MGGAASLNPSQQQSVPIECQQRIMEAVASKGAGVNEEGEREGYGVYTYDNGESSVASLNPSQQQSVPIEYQQCKQGIMEAVASIGVEALSAIRLFDFEDFKVLETFPRFPENKGMVVPLGQISEDIYKNSLIVFVSHCWLRGWSGAEGWDGRPHPDNAQGSKYQLCVEGIQTIKTDLAPKMEHCYIWLDYGCIDQNGNPAGELKMLDKIVQISDCIFTPIYDANPSWDYGRTITNLYEDYKSPGWKGHPFSYLNRGWCRVEMFYAANIPLFAQAFSPELHEERLSRFDHGIAYHQREGRRPHILYGSHEVHRRLSPFIMPPLLNSWFEEYNPEKGYLTKEDDQKIIHALVEELKPYMKTIKEGYEGGVNEEGEREGYGVYTYDNGESYAGDWKGGHKHGRGKYVYADGDYYVGEWVNGKRHGKGRIVSLSKEYYFGEFNQGIKEGYGVYCYPDGERYEGGYRQGKKHGEGKYFFADGDIIRGRYENGKRVQTLETTTGEVPKYIPIEERDLSAF